ncbi:MAG: glycosyltransferase family 4 protein [Myxococcales bacterium]
MRIALVSPPFIPVPPVGYGGTELVVAELACSLTRKGHEVVVYATGDSHLGPIEIRSYFPAAQWPPDPDVEATHAAFSLRDIARDSRGFDVVHVHTPAAVALSRICPYPMIATIHHDRADHLTRIYQENPRVRLVAISASQARKERAPISSIIHHGLDPDRFPEMPDQGYLLYIGRYSPEKGTHVAIEVAARAGLPIVLAGQSHDDDYYRERVLPLIERHRALQIGPVGGARKLRLMAQARALLFPIQWDEPFGLVMIESLLCGVPVLALRQGSVPEVIEDGVTGVIADDPVELVATARISETFFDRRRIRELARERWKADRMTDDYLSLYRETAEELTAADAG